MATFFLLLIYITFISLGLPDSMLGAAWPAMYRDLGVPLSTAGIITTLVGACTCLSSLLSDKVIRRFGTGKVTAVSVLLTAGSMLGISLAPHFAWMVLLALPLGLGAGAIDAGLNNYVALNYAARHMNWLHCFWGVGAFAGPMIMSIFIGTQGGWRKGYLVIAIIQMAICALLFVTLPLWKRFDKTGAAEPEKERAAAPVSTRAALKLPGVAAVLVVFAVYCGIEQITGLWSSTYLVDARGFSAASAAQVSGMYFASIAAGRFLSGILTSFFSNKVLIRTGTLVAAAGALLLAVPAGNVLPYVAIVLLGLGCAPVYPGSLKETPVRFGAQNSQKVIGLQMAAAYVGIFALPPLTGVLAARIDVRVVPYLLVLLAIVLFFTTERAARVKAAG